MTPRILLRSAARSLRHGGQRTLLALACVAFGVMSLVALMLLAAMVSDAILVDPRAALGGDALLTRGGRPLTAAELRQLDALAADGTIAGYTRLAPGNAPMLKIAGAGRVVFVNRALGVDPASYPLAGDLTLREPAGAPLSDVLDRPGNVVITYDMADKLGLKPGAAILLGGGDGPPARLRVAGIASVVPDHRGDSLLYNLATARALSGGAEPVTQAAVRWGAAGDRTARLEAAGWTVFPPDSAQDRRVVDLFGFMLKGAGVLGLLIGGIGVANTLHVLLARRTAEIATLKTLGYRRRDLLLLFGVETALLGALGAALGAGGGALLSAWFMRLLDQTEGSIMLTYHVDPWIVGGGALAGIATTVIFGMAAIVRASGVRPGVLLREQPTPPSAGSRLVSAGLYGVLLLVFAGLSGMIMGSALRGAAVVAGGLAGLLALGGLLGALLFGLLRLPLPRLPGLVLARRSLGHRPMRAVLALIALFVGVFAIGFSGAGLQSAQARTAAQARSNDGYNLTISGGAEQAGPITDALARAAATEAHLGYRLAASVRGPDGRPIPELASIEGRDDADAGWDVTLDAPWSGAPGDAYLPARFAGAPWRLARGDRLAVEGGGGAATFTIRGFYTPREIDGAQPPRGLLIDRASALRLGGPRLTVVASAAVPAERLEVATAMLSRDLPDAMVVSRGDLNAFILSAYTSLLTFVAAVASLSFMAGAVLIANAVGLAMIERRREIGILKAVGYSSGQVLRTLLLENGLLGLLAGVSGVAGVAVAVIVINVLQPQARLTFGAPLALGVVALAVLLALGSAALVAWRPARVRPLALVRQE